MYLNTIRYAEKFGYLDVKPKHRMYLNMYAIQVKFNNIFSKT